MLRRTSALRVVRDIHRRRGGSSLTQAPLTATLAMLSELKRVIEVCSEPGHEDGPLSCMFRQT